MRKLREFLVTLPPPHTQASWAERLGISQCYLSQILNGQRSPSAQMMRKIELSTGGAVPASSWFTVSDGAEEPTNG